MNTKRAMGMAVILAAMLACQSTWAFYNPHTGRWLSRDPIGDAGGVHLTAFTHNDLVNLIDLFGLWTRDSWSGGWASYTGTATAECGDTLSGLAWFITGHAEDWKVLGIPASIKVGQKVSVAPLLNKLEDRLRANVVAATKSFNPLPGLVPGQVPKQSTATAAVNQFFGATASAHADCTLAVLLVEAKGLIDTLRAGEFDKFQWTYSTFPKIGHNGTINQTRNGDATYFWNFDDTPSGVYFQGENLIKVANDSYWGWGGAGQGSASAQAVWYNGLRDWYNTELHGNRTDPVPGFKGTFWFIDTATVGTKTFDSRQAEKRGNKP